MQSKNLSKFAERREMPKVILSQDLTKVRQKALLVSGDLSYFVQYGLPLIRSFLELTNDTSLIINCVDFEMKMASSLITKYFGEFDSAAVILVKTKLSSLGYIDSDRKLSYLKTIRFYVAKEIRAKVDTNLIVADIDSLITESSFQIKFNELINSEVTFAVGATYDFLSHGLYNASNQNYIWRTIKAGFTYFKSGDSGNQAILRVVSKLFNIYDPIPPVDHLKLYRAYYGDQLSLLFTALELSLAKEEGKHHVKCIGFNNNELISFGSNPIQGSMWIPPASKRDNSLFKVP